MKARKQPLRVAVPKPEDIPDRDACGRRFHGRAAVIRRLYATERCSLCEIAAFFGIDRHQVSWVLRNKSSNHTRRAGLKALGRARADLRYSPERIVRSGNRWFTTGDKPANTILVASLGQGRAG
jgi:hypothetical protein